MRAAHCLSLSLFLLAAACGGSTDSSEAAAGSSGASGSAGTAGSGGTAGTAGTAGSGGSSGSAGTGGTSGSAGSGGTGPDATTACAAYAQAFCEKRDQCQDMGATHVFGSLDVCLTREAARCVTALGAPGTGANPVATQACAAALPGAACNDWLSLKPSVCPIQVGSNATGAACEFNAQCTTTYCAIPKNAACGMCAELPVEGADCSVTSNCGPTDLRCDQGTNKCIAVVGTGASCDTTHVCSAGLVCVGAKASTNTPGLCQAKKTTAGEVCDPTTATGPNCDHNTGVTCDKATQTCVAVTPVTAGATCGNDKTTGAFADCTGGTSCETVGTGPTATSTCMTPAADNAACDTAAGPPCLGPARCIVTSGTSGTCQLVDPTTCN